MRGRMYVKTLGECIGGGGWANGRVGKERHRDWSESESRNIFVGGWGVLV